MAGPLRGILESTQLHALCRARQDVLTLEHDMRIGDALKARPSSTHVLAEASARNGLWLQHRSAAMGYTTRRRPVSPTPAALPTLRPDHATRPQALADRRVLSAPLVVSPDLEDISEQGASSPTLLGWVDVHDVLAGLLQRATYRLRAGGATCML